MMAERGLSAARASSAPQQIGWVDRQPGRTDWIGSSPELEPKFTVARPRARR